MASNKQILLELGLDQEKLDSLIGSLGKKFNSGLKKALKDFDINEALGAGRIVTLKFNQAGTMREFEKVKDKIKITAPVKLDLTQAKAQIEAFQAGLKPLLIPIAGGQQQPTGPKTPTVDEGNVTTNLGFKQTSDDLRASLAADRAALIAYKEQLQEGGLSLVDIERKTASWESELVKAKVKLDQLDESAQQSNPNLDKLGRGYDRVSEKLDTFRRVLGESDPSKVVTVDKQQKVDSFFKNFSFSIGLIGYGMQNLGRHLLNVTRQIGQLTETTAVAIEPLQRITNLLSQDPTISKDDLKGIVGQIRDLADLPGANLDKISESLRVLLPLNQPISDTIQLIEGLTKAAARAGTGADGVARLAQQLRQFHESGQLRELDVKAITEQGGRDVNNVLRTAFGSTNAGVLQAAGPDQVIRALATGLAKLPAPLATTTDHLNRLKNSMLQIGIVIGQIIEPALIHTEQFLKTRIEPIINALGEKFQSLSESQKNFVSGLLFAIPAVLTALGAVLSVLGTLAIGVAVITKIETGWTMFVEKFPLLAEAVTPISEGFTAIFGSISEVVGLIPGIGTVIALVLAFATDFGRFRTTIVSGLDNMTVAFENFYTKVTTSSEKIGPLNIAFKNLAVVIAAVEGVFETLAGLIGTTIGTFLNAGGDIINFFADLTDALNSPWNELFGKILDAMNLLAARSLLSIKKFAYDAYISILEGGITIFRSVPGMQGMADQLELNVAGLEDYRKSLDGVSVSIDKQTGKITYSTAEEKKSNDEKKKTIVTDAEILKNMKEMASQARLLSESFNDVRNSAITAFDQINQGWADAAAKLRGASAKFIGDATSDQVTKDFAKLITSDVNSAGAQLQSTFDDIQNKKIAALKQSAKASATAISANINSILNQITTPQTVTGGALPKAFPNFEDWFNTLRNKLLDVNTMAAHGVTDWNAFSKALESARLAGEDISHVFSAVSSNLSPDELEKAKKDIQTISETISTNVKDMQGQATAVVEQSQAVREEIQKNIAAAKEEINLRQEALSAEQQIQDLKLDQYELNLKLTQQQSLLDNATQLGNISEIARITNEIAGLTQSISDKDAEIAIAQNYTNDQLKKQENSNQRDLTRLQNKTNALNTYIATIRQVATENANLFSTTIDGINDLITKIKEAKLSADLTGGMSKQEFLGRLEDANKLSGSQQEIISLQLRDALTKALKNFTLPVLIEPEFKAGKNPEDLLTNLIAPQNYSEGAKVLNQFGIKSEITTLINEVGNLSSTTFNDILDKYTDMLAKAIVVTKVQLKVIDDEIERTNHKLENPNLTDDERARLTENLRMLDEKRNDPAGQIKSLNSLEEILNAILGRRTEILATQIKQGRALLDQEIARLNIEQKRLELVAQLQAAQADNLNKASVAPGGAGVVDQAAVDSMAKDALNTQIQLLYTKYKIEADSLQAQKEGLELQLKASGANKEAIQGQIDALDTQLALLGQIYDQNKKGLELDAATKSTTDYKNALSGLQGVMNDRVLTNFAERLRQAAISQGKSFDFMADSAALFKDVGADAIVGAFSAMGEALIKFLETGDAFSQGFIAFLGTMLMGIGESLIQMSLAAEAYAFMYGLMNGGLIAALAEAAAVLPEVAIGVATGAALIIAGGAMGGTGKYSAANSASGATSSAADAKTGASSTPATYDPNKDPKTMYQKALMANITIDIRHDDGIIVKKIIKEVNSNGRLANLIGNNKMEFGY